MKRPEQSILGLILVEEEEDDGNDNDDKNDYDGLLSFDNNLFLIRQILTDVW